MKRLLPLCLILALPAQALTPKLLTFASSDGTTFYFGTTAEGEVFIAPDATPDDIFILRPDCTAENLALGQGTWGYANGGWLMQFPDRSIAFPRQEPPPVDGADCLLP